MLLFQILQSGSNFSPGSERNFEPLLSVVPTYDTFFFFCATLSEVKVQANEKRKAGQQRQHFSALHSVDKTLFETISRGKGEGIVHSQHVDCPKNNYHVFCTCVLPCESSSPPLMVPRFLPMRVSWSRSRRVSIFKFTTLMYFRKSVMSSTWRVCEGAGSVFVYGCYRNGGSLLRRDSDHSCC